jgi:YidC/Oxa1 family membrane protein insertase
MKNKSLGKKEELLIKILLFFIVFTLWQKIVVNPLVNRAKGNKGIVDFTKVDVSEKDMQKSENVGEDVVLENDFLKLTINTQGLLLNNLELKKFQKSIRDKSFVRLLDDDEKNYYYIKNSWISPDNSTNTPNGDALWNFDKKAFAKDNTRLVFNYKNEQGVVFIATFSFDEKYLLTIGQSIKNNSDKSVRLRPVLEIIKHDIFNRSEGSAYNGGIGVFDKKEVKEIKTKKLKKNSVEYEKFKWSGFTNKYWLIAVINKDDGDGKINFLKNDKDLKMQYTSKDSLVLLPNAEENRETMLFLGAKDRDVLQEYEDKNGFTLFTRSVDYGLFFFLTKPMSLLLNALYMLMGDFGLSILLFTIIIKLILYPSVKKTTVSTSKLKSLQPKLNEIQQRYKDDKMAMQREIIKLYKTQGVNPMGSLMPLFVQIPIFFSLYKVLSISLEMRQANFLSFIGDLSVEDPSNIFNLCGLLPFTPSFRIALLPFLMAFTMFLQQKVIGLGQKDAKQSEEMQVATNVNKWMPLVLLFVFSKLPSGLLLYWTWNNIITIIQQVYIEKKYC